MKSDKQRLHDAFWKGFCFLKPSRIEFPDETEDVDLIGKSWRGVGEALESALKQVEDTIRDSEQDLES